MQILCSNSLFWWPEAIEWKLVVGTSPQQCPGCGVFSFFSSHWSTSNFFGGPGSLIHLRHCNRLTFQPRDQDDHRFALTQENIEQQRQPDVSVPILGCIVKTASRRELSDLGFQGRRPTVALKLL